MSQLSAKITADISGYRKSIQDAKNVLKGFTKVESETAETLKKVYDVTNDQVNAYKKVTDSMLKATDGTKTIKQASNQLKNDIEKLKIQWANLSETARNSKFGQSMANSIRTAEAQLKSMQSTMPAATKSWTEIGSKLNIAGVNVGDLVGKIKTLNPAMVGVAGAAKIMTDAFMSSETAMDGVRRTMSGLQNAYDTFVRSVRDGDLDLGSIFGGYGKGKDKYDAEDALGSLQANNKAVYEQLQADIAKARDIITEGGDANVGELKKRVEGQYRELINSTKNVLDKSVDALARNEKQKTLIEEFLLGKNPNETLSRMQAEAKRLAKEMSTFRANNTTMEVNGDSFDTSWNSKSAERAYYEMEARKKNLDSIIDSESELQKLVETQTQINALETAQYNQLRTLSKMQNTIDNEKIRKANEQKKIYEDQLKLWQKEREEAKKMADGIDKVLSAANKNRSVSLQTYGSVGTVDISSAKNYVSGMSNEAKRMQDLQNSVKFDKWTGNLDNLNSSLSSVYDTMNNINNLDNPFKVFDALIGTATNVKNVVDTMQSLGTMMKTIGAINKAETANEIALDQAKIASNQAEGASNVGVAASETMAAHASIPFVGIAIATAAIGAMMAVLSSTKSKVPKFANGAVLSGPTFGLMGEYPGAANNPEVVAPLSKLKGMLKDESPLSGELILRARGRDLVAVLGKENRLNSRR